MCAELSKSDEYEALEVIGKGSYGIVRKVRSTHDQKIYVRKEIEYDSMNTHERNQLISELRILRELDHPNIVRYYKHEHVPEEKSIHIYMEYCTGGDLARLISSFSKNSESIPEEFIWQVLVQILLALHRCHYGINARDVDLFSNREKEPFVNSDTVIIHRDIKPENIFLLNSGKTAKLGDFGLAKMLTSKSEFAKTYVGTPYYMSPEVLMDDPYTPVCDIWSLGCVLFELCTLRPPFEAKTHLQLQSKIKKGQLNQIPTSYSSQLRGMIRDCITVDPDQRPSCYDLLECLSVRFLRKEIELKERSDHLNQVQKQLIHKSEELEKKEEKIKELREIIEHEKKAFDEEIDKMHRKYETRLMNLEEELVQEFETRKALMDQEAKDVRLGYQREFRLVVENEVHRRLKDVLSKQNQYIADSTTKNSEHFPMYLPKPLKASNESQNSPRLRGPKELDELAFNTERRKSPLKVRNESFDTRIKAEPSKNFQQKSPANIYTRRVTDELERLKIDQRNIPDYEQFYLRTNY